MDTSRPTKNHSVKMITPPYNTKRSSSPNVKVRTFAQRGEAEDLDDGKPRNCENKNASSPPRRHYDKKRKTERNSTDALEPALTLPSFACAASLLDPMKFSHARAAGSADRQHMDVDLAMVHEVDEPSSLPSTLSVSSPMNGTVGTTAGEMADTADCAIPPTASHSSSSSLRHTYRTYIPILSSEYPLNYLSTDNEPRAAAETQADYQNHHQYHDFLSRTGFPIYEDPDDIEIQFQEIRVNVFAPWDEDKENIDEGPWNGEPAEEGGGGGENQHEDSSTRNGNTHIIEIQDLTLNTNLDTDADMNMDMDLDLDLENITMFPAPENSLSSTPTTQHSMDTNAFNWDANAHLTTILTPITGDASTSSAAFFDEPEATFGPWTHVPDLVAPFSVVHRSQELPMDNGTEHPALASVDEITINPPPEFDFAEHDQVAPDASGLWLPWSSQSLTASEMAALALSVARQREEQTQGDQMLQQTQAQIDAAAGGKKVRRGTRRL
ncbi:hypothetical protein ASPACDRAFT_116265 [Aspergillus aculeatus ATCC 16872]|uniref:Uncharacterized protein n=1 Tax=Aspergillus aculeatus (strain ATCC 16872 / CBS 172.66 / WB 5094) TaxID=690307 RepID=A0A1L9WZ36_ASPA1|nr:uncharacterized protein ASPACDRAFT_116265 [Aspergillus aculeatus ATCC 16872]OJK01490.1 hypothetical protein ASPACDRAFT_116265 [Aspergillus aculeatus ATCC 16872]